MRSLNVISIVPGTSSLPSEIMVASDVTSMFHGKEWIGSAGNRAPFYSAQPAGSRLLVPTSFELANNPKFAGLYTVYTTPAVGGLASCEYNSTTNQTKIRVNESLPNGSTVGDRTTGQLVHISTYVLTITGEPSVVLLEQTAKLDRPIDLVGKLSNGWGEIFLQNLLRQAQSFAGESPPLNPFIGQLWYNTTNSELNIRTQGAWQVTNSGYFGGAPFRAAIPSPGGVGPTYTWEVTHDLNLPAPYVCSADFFVDVGDGVHKIIMPNEVTFSANSLTASFSQDFAGQIIIRA